MEDLVLLLFGAIIGGLIVDAFWDRAEKTRDKTPEWIVGDWIIKACCQIKSHRRFTGKGVTLRRAATISMKMGDYRVTIVEDEDAADKVDE